MEASNEEFVTYFRKLIDLMQSHGEFKVGNMRIRFEDNGKILFAIPFYRDKVAKMIKKNKINGEILLLYLLNLCINSHGTAMKVFVKNDVIRIFDYVTIDFVKILEENLEKDSQYHSKILDTFKSKKLKKGIEIILK